MGALENENPILEGVVSHIDFNKTAGKTRVSDQKLRDLIRHFSNNRLRNEDFEFPDLLGAAYEYLIKHFADSAGKKGGEFYTPRDVARLMVRLLKPQQGMRIYDPCVGSGGMLILSKEYVEEHQGNAKNLSLYGQEANGGVWAICKMNMILHGIVTDEKAIQNDDTIANPLHLEGGELMRFDRVISNPPFSQNYSTDGLKFNERFRFGFCPENGKKADLMFVQHMVAVLRSTGMMATVMPHGVLFRGGVEKEIRQKFIEDDLLEAVIGLPPNLFYGTGIPACILVMRGSTAAKPQKRQGKVLFINADAEFQSGRAQNFLTSFTEAMRPIKILEHYQVAGTMSQWLENNQNTLASTINQNFKELVENKIEAKAESLRKQAIQEQMLLFLDEFQVNGVIASWWNEIQYDLKTVAAQNFDGLIEGWVETIRADLDSDNKNGNGSDPLGHKLVVRLLPKYLQQLADYEAKKADLESQLAATKKSDEEGEEGELEDEEQLSEADIKKLKQDLSQVKKILTKFKEDLIKQLDNARKQLMMEQCQRLVLDIAKEDLENQLNRYVNAHRQQVISSLENWWDKYRVTLRDIEAKRDDAAKRLDSFLRGLGYVI